MKKTRIVPFAIAAVVIVVLAAATVFEKIYGTPWAHQYIYGAWWFVALWAVLAVVSAIYIWRQKLIKRPATFALHAAFLLILAGACTTHFFGENGTMHLRYDASETAFSDKNGKSFALPFAVGLADFRIETYPGTQSPMDYVSQIAFVADGDTLGSEQVSMNHVAEFAGYRFCQSGFDSDRQGIRLSVAHDPWGIAISYIGYALLALAMLAFLILPNESFRRILRRLRSEKMAAILFIFLLIGGSLNAAEKSPKAVPADVADDMCDLCVLYNGRVCPLQTMAADFTTKLYGKASYSGLSANQVFVSMLFYPSEWVDQPIVKLKRGNIRTMLGVDGKYASIADLMRHERELNDAMQQIYSTGSHPDKKAIVAAYDKLNLVRMLYSGQMLKIFPYADSTGVVWYSQADNLPMAMDNNQWMFIKKSISYMGELLMTHQYEQLGTVFGKIKTYQQKTAGAALPSEVRLDAEKLYNALNSQLLPAIIMLVIGLVAVVFYIRCFADEKAVPRALHIPLIVVLCVALAYLLLIFVLRWIVGGHIPVANGYETMQFMALCAIVLTLCVQHRFAPIVPFGYVLTGLILMVSMMGQSNPQITPLMPVLSSPLLSVHVAVIMFAYVLLAFTMLNGLTVSALRLSHHRRADVVAARLYEVSRAELYPALFALACGIFIGAVWANVSWGTYWSWDPKETWALITMLIYAVPLHRGSLRIFGRPMAFHIYMVLAFLAVLMTYFGVNFVLGGLHSYA